MTAPGPAEAQARIRLSALLFRAAMPRLAKALAAAGEPPPRPEEKERLLARLEEAAWSLGPEEIAGADGPEWEARVLERPAVAARLSAAVDETVRQRG